MPYVRLKRYQLPPDHPEYKPNLEEGLNINKGLESVACKLEKDGTITTGEGANVDASVGDDLSSFMQSDALKEYLQDFKTYRSVLTAIQHNTGQPSLYAAMKGVPVPPINRQDIHSLLLKPAQRVASFDGLLKEINKNLEGPGQESINDSRQQISDAVLFCESFMTGQKFTNPGTSNISQINGALKSLESFRNLSRSQLAEQAPARDAILSDALGKLEQCKQYGEGTNAALAEILRQIESQPGADKLADRITVLSGKLRGADGKPRPDAAVLRETAGDQIAFGNRQLADNLGMDLKQLAPNLAKLMRLLNTANTPEAKQGMRNILEFTLASGKDTNWDVSEEALSSIVETAREAGVGLDLIAQIESSPSLILKRTLESGMEGNLQLSTAQLLSGALSGTSSRDQLVWGSGSLKWDENARPFDVLAKKYDQLSTDQQGQALQLAGEFLDANVSLPRKAADREQCLNDIQNLIAQARAENDPKNQRLADELALKLENLPNVTPPPAKDLASITNSYDLTKIPAEQAYQDMATSLRTDLAQLNLLDAGSYPGKWTANSDVLLHQILAAPNPSVALQNYKKGIAMGKIAMERNDFETASAINSALMSWSAERLGFEAKLSSSERASLGNLKNTFDVSGLNQNYRTKVAELKPGTPYMPVASVSAADLVRTDEGNLDINPDGTINRDKLDLIVRGNKNFRAGQDAIKQVGNNQPSPQQAEFSSHVSQFQRLEDRDGYLWDLSTKIKPQQPSKR